MNTRILNRAGQLPTDGFYQIEALGEHVNHAAKVVQVIDDKAVESIVNRFNAEAGKGGEDFPGMRIDKDHLSQSLENPTESLGWNMQLRNRAGIPEAKIDWTALGRPLIESKPGEPPVYKFFSTEYDPAQVEKIGTRQVDGKTYAVVRPLRLDGLSLTNDPNNKGAKPISNRDVRDESQPTIMKTLLKKLGLSEDASEESGLAALEVILNRATTAEGKVTTITAERDGLLAVQVEVDLEKYAPVIKNRDSVKAALIANRKTTIEFLEGLKPAATEQTRITNRAGAATPDKQRAAGEVDEEAVAAKITNRANKLKGDNPKRTFDSCWMQAQREVNAGTE